MSPSRERECPVEDCTTSVPSHMLMCRRHWFSVPPQIRGRVWHAYRNLGVLSDEYIEARDEAVAAANAKVAR